MNTENENLKNRLQKSGKAAFTLAEVLIVIGVVGVVAAITIPTLINTISTKAKEAQTEVIEKRLLDGLNRFSTMDDGFSQKYESTYEFLEGLSAHYKMSAICDAADIPKCIPYSKINFTTDDGIESMDVSELTSIEKFMSGDAKDDYLPPAAFISAQGTPVIAAFKKGCVRDTGKAMISITEDSCLQIMYDKNGTGLPNKLGDDIVGMGLTIVPPAKGPVALATLGGVKIMTNAFVPDALTAADCNANKSTYGITNCRSGNDDYWGGAMKYCKSQGLRLPTVDELTNIAKELYNDNSLTTSQKSDLTLDTSKIPEALSGLSSSWDMLWSGSENSRSSADFRVFYADSSFSTDERYTRYTSDVRAVCVGD